MSAHPINPAIEAAYERLVALDAESCRIDREAEADARAPLDVRKTHDEAMNRNRKEYYKAKDDIVGAIIEADTTPARGEHAQHHRILPLHQARSGSRVFALLDDDEFQDGFALVVIEV